MIDEFKTLEVIEKEKRENIALRIKINAEIQKLYNNYVEASKPLFLKQEKLENRLEELDLEIKKRSENF